MSGVNGSLNGGGVDFSTPVDQVKAAVNVLPSENSRSLVVVESHAAMERFMPLLNIEQAVQRRQFIVDATSKLMQKEVDYGTIPGTQRPTLLQPGADKLCNLFGIVIQYDFLEKTEDWTGEDHGDEPFFYYQVRARAYRGDFLMGEGVGACSSWESKYRYRNAERVCPNCNKPNIRRSKEAGWYCWRKTDGCGATFPEGSAAIESQQVGKKLNPDVTDTVNTVLKMAYKRAKLSATINATSASEFFTQDMEDFSISDEPAERSSAAAQAIARDKIERRDPGPAQRPWRNMGEMRDRLQAKREQVGETAWRAELERYGFTCFQDIRNAIDNNRPNAKEMAVEIYYHLDALKGKVA